MKYLRLFKTESEYNSKVDYLEFPCVSYVDENQTVKCEPHLYYIDATYRTPTDAVSTLDLGAEYNIILGLDYYSEYGVPCDRILPINKIICNGQVLSKETYENLHEYTYPDGGCLKSYDYMYNFSDEPTTFRIYFNEKCNRNLFGLMYANNSLISIDFSGYSSPDSNISEGFRECWNLEEVNFGKLDLSQVSLSLNLALSPFSIFNRTNIKKITMLGKPFKVLTANVFDELPENGEFYCSNDYDYSEIIEALPDSWRVIRVSE